MRSFIVGFALAGCIGEFHQGNGRSATESRVVGAFDEVTAATSIPVDVTGGPYVAVTVTCDENLLDYIVTEVEGDALVVRTQQHGAVWVHIEPTLDCRVQITTPRAVGVSSTGSGRLTVTGGDLAGLRDIASTGSGGVVVGGRAVAPDVTVSSAGSGDVTVAALEATHAALVSSGSGEIAVWEGACDALDLTIAGSGGVDAGGVIAADVHATLSGSGSGEVTATDALHATLSGSGDLLVFGDPEQREVTEAGSGRVEFE